MLLAPTCTGDTLTGDRFPASGVVRDLDVSAGGYGQAGVSLAYVAANPDEHVVGVFLDGEMVKVLRPDETSADLVNLAGGRHSIDVFISRPRSVWPDRHGNLQGSRAYLIWDRSTDTTCAGYRVYWDQGLGGAVDTLLKEINQVSIAQSPIWFVSGGRVKVWGDFNGLSAINNKITLTISSGDTTTWSATIGDKSATGTVLAGASALMPFGAWVQFLDDPSAYSDGASIDIAIGPQNFFLSDSLEDGVAYVFRVAAIDVAGNESVALDDKTVEIAQMPAPIDSVVFQDAGLYIDVSFFTSDFSNATEMRIYSNYNVRTEQFEQHIIEDSPQMVTTLAFDGWIGVDFYPAMEGKWMFYCRPLGTNGIELHDSRIFRCHFPATPDDLGIVLADPSNLKLTPIAGGKIRVEVDYRLRENDDLDLMYFWIDTTPDHSPTATLTRDQAQGANVLHFTFESTAFADSTAVDIYVKSSGAGALSQAVTGSATADDLAPDFAGSLQGVSQ